MAAQCPYTHHAVQKPGLGRHHAPVRTPATGTKPEGNGKLSKRDGDRLGFPIYTLNWENPLTGEKISGLAERGFLPEAYMNFLALLGWHPGRQGSNDA